MDNNHEHVALAVQAEHRQLHQRLHDIERLLTSDEIWEESLNRLLGDLRALRRQLAEHFEREENGGFLDEAVALAPRFSHDARRLMRDHSSFLAELDGIIRFAEKAAASEATELRERTLDLFHALRLHEAGEERILQQMFPSEV
ncbi:MAG: hypothetical protein HY000_18005 [Planctomycetes bacterium]|nr:hypothetical protein [Planctomycetota bacterium]